jgi:protein-tyrosine phosphatase
LDKFQHTKRKLDEKTLPSLDEGLPILTKNDTNQYFLFWNEWRNMDKRSLKLECSSSPNGDFKSIKNFKWDGNWLNTGVLATNKLFFKIIIDAESIVIGERLMDIGGTVNFRDIGGYLNQDGQTIQWGKIFRSGHLYKLSDHNYFKSTGITDVIDLRSEPVRKRLPDKLPKHIQYNLHSIPMESKGLELSKLRRKILKNDLDDFDAKAILIRSYGDFITVFNREIKKVFQILLEAKGGVLIHCSAGKDRTGFFIAMILKMLEVDEKTIKSDYLASNYFRKKETKKILQKIKLFANVEKLIPLLEVQEDYLDAAFQAIDEKYGTFDQYIIQGLGWTIEDLKQLQAKYINDFKA